MDEELTKKAIEELLRETNDSKERDGFPTERKKNPLGKPNKRFLGRTINSMMMHNKRQSDYNRKRCQRKLQELDAKQRKREHRQTHRAHEKHIRRRSRTESLHEVMINNCDDNHKKFKKIKRKRKKKQKSSISPPSSSISNKTSSSSESESSSNTVSSRVKRHENRKTKRHSNCANNGENEEEFNLQMAPDTSVGYYIDPHIAYAAMAYGHFNQVLHQQMVEQEQIINDEFEETVEIPSDLSISYHSESSLNISVHSSSAEEDENGILTFKLLSSDEELKSPNIKKINSKKKSNENFDLVAESDEGNKSSEKSCISLASTSSQKSKRQTNEIVLLSSSTSDSDDLELIETVSEPKHMQSENQIKDKEDSVEYFNANSIDEIKNTTNTNEDNSPEGNNGKESLKQSVETEKSSKEIEGEQKGQLVVTNNKENIQKMENAEESDKNINIIKNYNVETNENLLNKIGLPENYTSTTMIDLTEE